MPLPSPTLDRVVRRVRLPALAAAALLVIGCATIDQYVPTARSFGVYKLDINQGNFLTQDLVDKLKVGQTKQQVRAVLGTPLITPAFRDNRWDYVYEFVRQGRIVEHRNFTVYFVDDKLARWEGDEMPTSAAVANRAAAEKSLAGGATGGDGLGFFDWFRGIFGRR